MITIAWNPNPKTNPNSNLNPKNNRNAVQMPNMLRK